MQTSQCSAFCQDASKPLIRADEAVNEPNLFEACAIINETIPPINKSPIVLHIPMVDIYLELEPLESFPPLPKLRKVCFMDTFTLADGKVSHSLQAAKEEDPFGCVHMEAKCEVKNA